MSNNTELIAQLRWIGVGTLNFNDRCALMWEAAQALEQAGLEMGKRDRSSEQMKELTHSTATALAFAEQKIAEQAATIEAMYATVFDPISDYYGEIRVKFDALQVGASSTGGAR